MNEHFPPDDTAPGHDSPYLAPQQHDPNSFEPLYNRHTQQNPATHNSWGHSMDSRSIDGAGDFGLSDDPAGTLGREDYQMTGLDSNNRLTTGAPASLAQSYGGQNHYQGHGARPMDRLGTGLASGQQQQGMSAGMTNRYTPHGPNRSHHPGGSQPPHTQGVPPDGSSNRQFPAGEADQQQTVLNQSTHPPVELPLNVVTGPRSSGPVLANGGVRTRKPKRTPEQMRLAEVIAAEKRARKFQQQADKAADARQKQATNAAKKMLKAHDAANATPRPTWSEEQTIELLNFVRMVKEDHSQTRVTGGFIPFGKYFASYTGREEAFPLLLSISNATRLARYRAVMDKWKKVKDCVDRSGAAGLSWALDNFKLSQEIWDLILDMHGDNPAATGEGLCSSLDDYESLLHESGALLASSERSGSSDGDDSDGPLGTPGPPKKRKTKYDRLCEGLTPAELALDMDSDADADLPKELVLGPSTTASGSATPGRATPSVVTPATPLAAPVVPAPGGAQRVKNSKTKPKSSAANTPVSRPPTDGGSIPRRRGWVEDKPREDDSTANGMLMMMHRSQESSAAWAVDERKLAMEERTRQDNLRAEEKSERLRLEEIRADEREAQTRRLEGIREDERRAAEKRADAMEVARRDEMIQAKEEREILREQAKTERALAEHRINMEREAAKEAAIQAAEDRKRDREEAIERKAQEKKREEEREDRAEKQQQSRQLFELAMLKAMARSSVIVT
ncbi:uncharacterized protein PGTG_21401 [Puccinia graminis f. sp. tritici CRL 75-36-700-3]|uniref:Uncharacterized protein n=1 Tax=Puccinia graminis f. sp. tritici (strain CRL 75-36-700-3 / race SCCL) TaxID=418459 RepID=H6QR79_PUCGT|nr:uncharacterized protein PGTG_21401 [Puccinia graminis f. sp. tritici CRL 75-36-700-3]EHS63061.1 hypothetical protein PGTG_21401 [Puccinia graminis f. sp. tritici CRL 75-36-700-3]